ncbi:hypothetical protein LguiA_004602 [Lonicera macranthoides]
MERPGVRWKAAEMVESWRWEAAVRGTKEVEGGRDGRMRSRGGRTWNGGGRRRRWRNVEVRLEVVVCGEWCRWKMCGEWRWWVADIERDGEKCCD